MNIFKCCIFAKKIYYRLLDPERIQNKRELIDYPSKGDKIIVNTREKRRKKWIKNLTN